MPYANQLGNKYNKQQEKVDIHDKRIGDFTVEDINKILKVSSELGVETAEFPPSVATETAVLDTSSTSIQVPYSGIYLSTIVIDSITKEEVLCDIIHGIGNVTINVAEPPANPLSITVVHIITS